MDLLAEFVFIISKSLPASLDTFLPPKSKLRQFFDMLAADPSVSDAKAAQIMYSCEPSEKKYLMLKRNVLNKLVELLLLTGPTEEENTDLVNTLLWCDNHLNISKKLLNHNVFHNAEKILIKVLQKSSEYYLVNTRLQTTNLLSRLYSMKGDVKKTQHYIGLSNSYSAAFLFENKVRGYLQILESKIKYSVARNPEIFEEAKRYYDDAIQNPESTANPHARLLCLQIKSIMLEQTDEFLGNLLTVAEKLSIINQYPFLSTPSEKLRILLAQARYFRRIQNICETEKYISEALTIADYRAFNKFEVQEIHFDLQIKKQNYEKAGAIIREVREVPQFEYVYDIDKSAWFLREAYLYFVCKALSLNKIIEEYTPHFVSGFSYRSFIENTKYLAADKKGYNVQMLIIRYLFLYKKDEDLRIKEAGNLRIYFHRYLQDIPAERTKSFIKALYRLGRDNFEIEKIIENGIYLHEKFNVLKKIPTYDNLELIPYEIFWEMITKEFLDKKYIK